MRLQCQPAIRPVAFTTLLVMLVVLVAACGSDADSSSEEPIAAATPSAAPTETPTKAPTETPTEAPTETPTAAPTESPTATATPEPTPTEAPPGFIEVEYANGGVVGGVGRAKVPTGEAVELHVVADVTDEVHVHGYDVFGHVAPGAPAVLTFDADIPGVWEVELEGLGQLLVELEVS